MGKKVFIVEDNDLNMKLFTDLLVANSYEVGSTMDGRDAVEKIKEFKPSLVLMDIQMPEISGLEVARMLKDDEETKNIPIVAVTAFAMKGDEEKIREGGCDDYITKPISILSFLQTVAKYFPNA